MVGTKEEHTGENATEDEDNDNEKPKVTTKKLRYAIEVLERGHRQLGLTTLLDKVI